MNHYIQKIFNRSHQLIIGGDAGENMKRFAKNISVSLAGGLSAFVILFFVSVIAARVLGPEEYGKYAVFFSIAQIVSLFFVLELDVSALYFLSQKTKAKNEIISSIIGMFFLNVIIFSFLALSIYHFFDFDNVSLPIFIGALVMGFSYALKRIIDAFLRVEGNFALQSVLRFVEAVSVLVVIGVLFYCVENKTYLSYAASIIFGGIFFSVLGLWFLRAVFSFREWNTRKVNEIFHYNSYGLINAFVNGVVKNMDKVLAAALLGLSAAGLYAVYFTASVVIGARVTQIFINVFFPSVRKNTKNIKNVYTKINTIFMKLFIPLVICASGGVALIIWFYGSAYQFVWLWVMCGGVYIAVHFFAALYGWLLSSVSQRGYKFYNISFLYGAVAYGAVLFFALMLNTFSITTFFIALIFYRAASGVFSFMSLRDHV